MRTQLHCCIGSLKPYYPPLPPTLHPVLCAFALPQVRAAGGLRVIIASLPDNRRSELQLRGRAGRWAGAAVPLLPPAAALGVGGHAGCGIHPTSQPGLCLVKGLIPPAPPSCCKVRHASYPTLCMQAGPASASTFAPSLAQRFPVPDFNHRRQGDPGESHLVLSFDDPVLNLRRPGVASLPQATYGALSMGHRCMQCNVGCVVHSAMFWWWW